MKTPAFLALSLALTLTPALTRADETCSSPYLARIEGQEEFVYVWTLGVEGLGDGKCRVFDVSDPQKPKQIYEKQIGKQLNMVSQSWDGKRLFFTSSLLARWDKSGADNEQFLRAFSWDGKELKPTFDLDFTALKLGRPHHMLFGSTKLGPARTVASK